jgi:hypothetical protein
MTHELLTGLMTLPLLLQLQSAPKPLDSSAHPYQQLFTVQPQHQRAAQNVTIQHGRTPARAETTAQVLRGPCNMPIIVANPAVDPKMVVPIEKQGTEPKIRAIEPPVCGHGR